MILRLVVICLYQTQLRLKDNTSDKLKFIAEQQCRSMNQQIEYIILQFIADYEKVNGPISLTSSDT